MKKIIVTLAAIAMIAGTGFSQKYQGFGGLGFYYPGVQFIMPASLGDILPAASYPETGFGPITHAGGGYVVMRNFLFGAEGGEYTGGKFTMSGRQVDLAGDFGGFKLGYIALRDNNWFAYPFAYYGGSTMEIYIHGTDEEGSFNTILSEPALSSRLICESSVVSVGAGFVYSVVGAKDKNVSSGFMVGLEAGYQIPVSKSEWTYDNGRIIDGPPMDFQGFFVRLAIGGGGIGFKEAGTDK
jgi:hypothetical protein